MRINYVTAKNFLSWPELELDFSPGVIAVTGENKTQVDQGSNGTGKSSIQQAIYFAIFGNSMKNILDKKLIQNGEDSAQTEIELYCPVREQALKIERILSIKGSAKLKIFLNDQPVTFANITDGNRTIVEWIGISPEDIKSYFIVCKEFYKSFFKSSDTEKLALISRFINFSYIDRTKDIIEGQIDELNAEKRALETNKAVLEGKLQVYEETLVEEEMRDLEEEKRQEIEKLNGFISTTKEEIKELRDGVETTQETIEEKKREFDLSKEQLEEAQKALEELPKTEEADKVIEELKETLGSLSEEQRNFIEESRKISNSREQLKKELQRVNINLAGTIKCPKCNHEFLTLKGTTLEEEKKKKEEIARKDQALINEEGPLETKMKECEDLIAEFLKTKNEVIEERDQTASQLIKARDIISTIDYRMRQTSLRIQTLQNNIKSRLETVDHKLEQIQRLEQEIQRVSERKDERKTEELEANIESTADLIRLKEGEIEGVNSAVFGKNQWINRFKDFKRYLAIEQLKNIQNSANELLKKQRSDLRVLLEGFKVGANGKVKEGITPYVLREEAESFWFYSGGERARVEIAVIMAFQSLINQAHPYGGLDFLFIDEVLEGLSEDGLYNVIDSLDFVKYPILIITHISNQNVKCQSLKVEKVNNISRLA